MLCSNDVITAALLPRPDAASRSVTCSLPNPMATHDRATSIASASCADSPLRRLRAGMTINRALPDRAADGVAAFVSRRRPCNETIGNYCAPSLPAREAASGNEKRTARPSWAGRREASWSYLSRSSTHSTETSKQHCGRSPCSQHSRTGAPTASLSSISTDPQTSG